MYFKNRRAPILHEGLILLSMEYVKALIPAPTMKGKEKFVSDMSGLSGSESPSEEEEWNEDEEDASPVAVATSSKKRKVASAKCNRLPKRLALSKSEDMEVGSGDSSPKSAEVAIGKFIVGGGSELGTHGNTEGLVDKLRRLSNRISNLKNKSSEALTKDPSMDGEENDVGEKTVAIEDSPIQDLPKEEHDKEIRGLDEENVEKRKAKQEPLKVNPLSKEFYYLDDDATSMFELLDMARA